MRRSLFLSIAAIMISGCSAPSERIQLTDSDYGPYPNNYEKIVKKYFKKYFQKYFQITLSVPSSAQYEFSAPPSKGYTRKVPIDARDIDKAGWIVVVLVNSPDRTGGYGRWKKYTLLIHNDRVIGQISPNPNFSEWWYR